MSRLYTILAYIGWVWLPLFFLLVAWRMRRMKVQRSRGFEVISSHEKQL